MADDPNRALAVIGDRRALGWVLTQGIVAFPEPQTRLPAFEAGDSIYLYTTRGCFKNPTRDRSRIVGKAVALTDLQVNEDPVRFGDRSFPLEVRVRIDSLAPVGDGINFANLVPQLTSFPKPERWSVYLRRSAFRSLQPTRGDSIGYSPPLRASTLRTWVATSNEHVSAS